MANTAVLTITPSPKKIEKNVPVTFTATGTIGTVPIVPMATDTWTWTVYQTMGPIVTPPSTANVTTSTFGVTGSYTIHLFFSRPAPIPQTGTAVLNFEVVNNDTNLIIIIVSVVAGVLVLGAIILIIGIVMYNHHHHHDYSPESSVQIIRP